MLEFTIITSSVCIGHPQCETLALPGEGKVTPFEQMLLVGSLRPDRMVSVMTLFCAKSLKLPELAVDTSLKGVLEESKAHVPILILTSPGADPSSELMDLAREKGLSQTFIQVTIFL